MVPGQYCLGFLKYILYLETVFGCQAENVYIFTSVVDFLDYGYRDSDAFR